MYFAALLRTLCVCVCVCLYSDLFSALPTEACALSLSPVVNHWLVHLTKWIQSKDSYQLTYSQPGQGRQERMGGRRDGEGVCPPTKAAFSRAAHGSFIPQTPRSGLLTPLMLPPPSSRMRGFVSLLLHTHAHAPTHTHTH